MMKEPYIAAIGNACYDEYYSADSWVENGEKLLIRPMEKQAGRHDPQRRQRHGSLWRTHLPY